MKRNRSFLSFACSLLPLMLAAITYWLWWTPKRFVDVEPYPLTLMTLSFWATVVAILLCAVLLRRHIRVAAIPLLFSALIVAIPAGAALTMTGWWLQGIPQADIRGAAKQPR